MSPELGAVYRAELANEMKDLGFQIERDGESFSITGTDKELMQEWSKRRESIKEKMAERGVSGAKAAEIATLATRQTKQEINRKEQFKEWQQTANEYGFNPDLIRNAELAHEQPEFDAKEILSQATDQQAVFSKANLHTAVAQQLQGIGTAEEIEQRIDQLEKDGELINLGFDKDTNLQQFTTKEMIELERSIANFAEQNQDNSTFKLSNKSIQNALKSQEKAKGYPLSSEQKQALEHITGKGQVSVVQGEAGTGKSTMLAAANEAFTAEGFKVQGLALASKAATGLQEGSGIQSQTIHSYIFELEKGTKTLDSKTVLTIDEAGMVDTKILSKLTTAAEQAGAKVVMVGDAQQLQAIGAGGAFEAVADKIGKAELTEIYRQKSDADKQSLQALRKGDAKAFLSHMKAEDRLHITKRTATAHKQMSNKFISSSADMKDKIMIAGRRADVAREPLNKPYPFV